MLSNTRDRWGWMSIGLHWLTAATVIGLFILGLWMVELNYYHGWYRAAPALHKSVGIVLFVVILLRLIWSRLDRPPAPLATHSRLERVAAVAAHWMMYVLLLLVMTAGYLISTAEGRPIDVFGLFAVPATLYGIEHQEDIAGKVHRVLAYALIGIAAVHALAALKHHFIDKDRTLTRMLGLGHSNNKGE